MKALSKAIHNVGQVYHDGGEEASNAEKVQAGMQKVLSNPRFWRTADLGDPINWLPPKKRKHLEQSIEETWKKCLNDPKKLSSAKDEVGLSDIQARTLLRKMAPTDWPIPSAKQLVAARRHTNEEIQVTSVHKLLFTFDPD